MERRPFLSYSEINTHSHTWRRARVDHVPNSRLLLLLLPPLRTLRRNIPQEHLRREAGGLVLQHQGPPQHERVRVQVRAGGQDEEVGDVGVLLWVCICV